MHSDSFAERCRYILQRAVYGPLVMAHTQHALVPYIPSSLHRGSSVVCCVCSEEEVGCWEIQFIIIDLVTVPARKLFSHQNSVGEDKRLSKMPGCLTPVQPTWTFSKIVWVPIEIWQWPSQHQRFLWVQNYHQFSEAKSLWWEQVGLYSCKVFVYLIMNFKKLCFFPRQL